MSCRTSSVLSSPESSDESSRSNEGIVILLFRPPGVPTLSAGAGATVAASRRFQPEERGLHDIQSRQPATAVGRAGAGVSILARSSVRRDVELGQVETRVIASDAMAFDVYLVFSKVAEHSRAARATAAGIRNIASTLFDRSGR